MYADYNVNYIRMYDTSNTTKGPFTAFAFHPKTVASFLALHITSHGGSGSGSGRRYGDTNIEVLARATWTSFSFSPEGDYILVRECVDGQGASSFLWRSSDDLHIIH